MKRCASCGRRLPAGDIRKTGVIFSSFTRAYYCGPRQGLKRCAELRRARARKEKAAA